MLLGIWVTGRYISGFYKYRGVDFVFGITMYKDFNWTTEQYVYVMLNCHIITANGIDCILCKHFDHLLCSCTTFSCLNFTVSVIIPRYPCALSLITRFLQVPQIRSNGKPEALSVIVRNNTSRNMARMVAQ